MSHKRFTKLLLVVLALALWAGTANAAASIVAAVPTNLAYTSATTNLATTTSAITGGDDGVITPGTIVYVTGTNWITSAVATGTMAASGLVTITLNTTTAALMGAGTFTATIPLTDATANTGTFTVTLVVTSPLAATTATPATAIYAVVGQAAATYTNTVTSTETGFATYTVVPTGCPASLTFASTHSATTGFQAKSTSSDTLTFTLNPIGQAAATNTGCVVTLKYNAVTFATMTFSAGLNIVTQPLVFGLPAPTLLTYNKGTLVASANTTVYVRTNIATLSVAFVLDVATVPAWLTLVSGVAGSPLGANTGTGTGNASGDPVIFSVNTSVAPGMATGNYTAQVGFSSLGLADVLMPITLQISNAAPAMTTSPSAQVPISFTSSMSVPKPPAAIFSTGEPVPFIATCSVVATDGYPTKTAGFQSPGTIGCHMNDGTTNSVNGTAFTWGFPMTVTLDPLLFANTVLIGNTVTVTVTFSGLPAAITAPAAVSYLYTIQPGVIASPLTLSPTSVAASLKTGGAAGSSFIVLLKGNNFVGPGSLSASSAVVGTQVWLGGILLTNANAATLGSYVVLGANKMQVTIVGAALPALVSGKAGTFIIGAANQTGPALPALATAALATLTVTNSPVIYGITSTASYNQPAAGVAPSFAPYDLISIFGDNFGFTTLANTSANASYDAFSKIVSPLTLGTAAAAGSKPLTLAVSFKEVANGAKAIFNAPVLFANQNQINLLVPAGVVADQNVTITAAGATSDSFLVKTVVADPAIFTLNSAGMGQGAIVNQDATVNGTGKAAPAGSIISIYLAGLGVPDSIGFNAATANPIQIPTTCVAISGTTAAPGILNVKNLKVTSPAYTPPSPLWTNIDGAVMNYGPHDIILGTTGNENYPPCMATATFDVTFGTPGVNALTVSGLAGSVAIPSAGFVSGSVAGLYQINVKLPAVLTGAGTTPLTFVGAGDTPVSVVISPAAGGTYSSQSGVTIVF